MKNTFHVLILVLLFATISFSQEINNNKSENTTKTKSVAKGVDAPQAVEGDVVFSDGTNNLLRITDEGTTGAIQFQNGVPSDVTNKLYNNSGILHFNGTALGSGGANSLDDLTDAKYENASLFLGNEAGLNNANAYGNLGIGWQALYNNTSSMNIGIGRQAGVENTTGIQNVLIGSEANRYNQTGSNNTIIGHQAGFGDETFHNKSGSVFIGFRAGKNELTSNKLYIENSDSDTPLIWGDFADDSLELNAKTHISNSLSVGSGSKAIVNNSISVGNNTEAHGLTSIAVGEGNLAWGFHSSAFGLGVKAMSYAGTAIGRYNVGDPLDIFSEWIENDVLFEIGNGTDNNNRSNAVTVLKNGNVGFGPSAPTSSLHVDAVNGVLFNGATTGSIPVEGSGSRMMWYQGKSAFRAGNAGPNNAWDDVNIGSYSTALNYRTTASGTYSFATGYQTEASGQRSTAMGSSTIASGLHSTAIGSNAEAVGDYSTAIGRYVKVGAAATGTIFIGDNSVATMNNATTPNRFSARFDGGYRFFTKADLSTGALMNNGDNSWSIVSDSTKKENFRLVNGEEVLNKISKFNLTSWNYKTQDPSKFRHYGPMAQEFYSAFGNDGIGTIGNDTTIASADFDGINLIAIQALEKRTEEQKVRIAKLETRIEKLESNNQNLAKLNSEYRKENSDLREDMMQIKQILSTMQVQNKNYKIASGK